MKITTKVLFTIMALSATQTPVSASDKKRALDADEQQTGTATTSVQSSTKKRAKKGADMVDTQEIGTMTDPEASSALIHTPTPVDLTEEQRAEILRCLTTAIHEALGRSMLDPKTGESLLHILTKIDQTGVAITHMAKGSINEYTQIANNLGITVLVQAIAENNEAVVRALLPVTNLRQLLHVGDGKNTTTYLHLACEQDNDVIFDAVLAELLNQCQTSAAKEAALKIEDSQGFTVAETALNLGKNNHLATLARLPECPMFVSRKRGSKSLLHLAIERHNAAGLATLTAPDILAAHETEDLVNAADAQGNTPVHYAMQAIQTEKNKEFFKILYALDGNAGVATPNKPNFTLANAKGKSPIMLVTNPVAQQALIADKNYTALKGSILAPNSGLPFSVDSLVSPATYLLGSAGLFYAGAQVGPVASYIGALVPTVYYLWAKLSDKVNFKAQWARFQTLKSSPEIIVAKLSDEISEGEKEAISQNSSTRPIIDTVETDTVIIADSDNADDGV